MTDMRISLTSSWVCLVDVTLYAKNQAVNKSPMASSTNGRCGYTTSRTSLVPFSSERSH